MSSSKKIYISLIVFALFYIFLVVFAVLPMLRGIKENSQALQLAKNKLNSLTLEEEQGRVREELYRNYQSDLERMEKIFIDPDVPLDFINFLEKTASSSQVQLDISSVTKKVTKEDPWPSLLVQISVTGFFPNFLEFLARLENSPYLIEVLDLTAKKLTEREIKPAETSLADTTVNLFLKVFTK